MNVPPRSIAKVQLRSISARALGPFSCAAAPPMGAPWLFSSPGLRASSARRPRAPCSSAATRSSGSTISTIITIRRSSRRGSISLDAAVRQPLPLRAGRLRRRRRAEARWPTASTSTASSTSGAQAGVRYSIENPAAYVQSNLVGHCNMLELARAAAAAAHRSMPPPRRSTAATRACRSGSRTGSIIRCRSTPRPRRPTSC